MYALAIITIVDNQIVLNVLLNVFNAIILAIIVLDKLYVIKSHYKLKYYIFYTKIYIIFSFLPLKISLNHEFKVHLFNKISGKLYNRLNFFTYLNKNQIVHNKWQLNIFSLNYSVLLHLNDFTPCNWCIWMIFMSSVRYSRKVLEFRCRVYLKYTFFTFIYIVYKKSEE